MVKAPSGNPTLDSGTILFDGCKVGLDFPSAADSMGRETVFRDQALASHLDLIQNVFLGREIPRRACSAPSGSWIPRPCGFLLDTPTAALGVVQAKNMLDTKDATAGQAVHVINFHQEWPSEAGSHV
jgi:hypothetical protein